jgi:LacI family transcriptional regulator
MKKHVTLFDICKKAGVSSATVSRVINQSPLVHARTRTKVMKAIRELGYHPSHAARMLARQRTDTIGVIFPDIAGGFYADVLGGIDDVAAESSYHIVTAFSHGDQDTKKLVAAFAQERRVDAMVIMNLFASTAPVIKSAVRDGMAVVLLDRPVPGLKTPTICIDNVNGADAAMTHLLDLGYRRIAYISGPQDNFDAQQRMEGVRRAMNRAGVALTDELVWQGNFGEESARQALRSYLDRWQSLPEAIFACNDAMAISAMATLQDHGYRVPDDVAIVGFDDIDAARHLGLTTVRVPMREMGTAAAHAALEKIQGQEPVVSTMLMPAKLMVRRSCGAELAASRGAPAARG